MADMLFWFLVSQTLAGLPAMTPGTQVRIVSADLLTLYAVATVEDNQLVFEGLLEPNTELRLLIIPGSASESETVAALQKAPIGHISPGGDDLLIQFEGLEGPISFKKWLAEERNITLRLVPSRP